MSFIRPTGEVRLIKNYTGDKGYNHTVRFESLPAQVNYFNNLVGTPRSEHVFTAQKYTNYTKNSIRIPYNATKYYGCNYLMFRSMSNSKWFFAFVDKIEYINNNLCEIFYTIDIIQSWYFDYKLSDCYVVREHSLTDNLFEHLVEEDLEVGDYIVENRINFLINGEHDYNSETYSGFSYRVFVTERLSPSHTGPVTADDFAVTWSEMDGIPVPFSEVTFFNTGTLYDYLGKYISANKTDAILTVLCTRNYGESTSFHKEDFYLSLPYNLDGYTPKNMKMYNYPFVKIGVTNNLGSSLELKPELFPQADNEKTVIDAKLRLSFVENCNTTCVSAIVPRGYRKVVNNANDFLELDFSNALLFEQYPSLPWSKDAFSTWMIANQNQARQNIANTVLSAFGNMLSFGANASLDTTAFQIGTRALNTGIDIHNKVSMLQAKVQDLKAIPPSASVQSLASPVLLMKDVDRFGFTIDTCVPHYEYAEMCDNYLSMFGYSVKRVKTPNLALTEATLRPKWNYLKTMGCNVVPRVSGLPAEEMEIINSIYDKGITFWEETATMYDYTADNSAQVQARKVDE